MSNSSRRPWRILLPSLGLIAISLLWSVYWYIAIGIAKQQFQAERSQLAARGLVLECAEESWSGYPFRFEYSCSSPAITAGHRYEVHSGNLLAVVLAYYPWQAVVLVDGPSQIRGLMVEPLEIHHQRAMASMTVGRSNQFSFSGDLPRLEIPGLGSAGRLRLDTRPATGAEIEIAASGEALIYQPMGKAALRLDHANAHGFLTVYGQVSVEKFEAAQDNVRVSGQGKIGLDQQRRLSGKLSAETNDLDGVLVIAEPYLKLTEQQKTGLRTVLGLLGNASKADIIAQDGQLFVGPFKVRDLGSLY